MDLTNLVSARSSSMTDEPMQVSVPRFAVSDAEAEAEAERLLQTN